MNMFKAITEAFENDPDATMTSDQLLNRLVAVVSPEGAKEFLQAVRRRDNADNGKQRRREATQRYRQRMSVDNPRRS